jgi:cellulose synthase/poly-beta-1,6-N-acetylglucosamine synthase-like glycosyltransferase
MEFVGWNFYSPGMRLLAGSAWFGGAGAAWRKDVIQEIGLDPSKVTEDIDASVRAMLKGHTIIVAPWARIHELCPSTIGIFLRQRLRWAVGWEQVTWSKTPKIIYARMAVLSRLRILSILTARYFGAGSGMLALVNFVATTTRFVYEHQKAIALPIALLSSVSGAVSASAGVTIILVVLFNGEGRDQAIKVVSFLLFAPIFVIFQLYSILHSWAVLLCCTITWVPTTRTANGKVHRICLETSKRHVHMPLDVVEPLEEA